MSPYFTNGAHEFLCRLDNVDASMEYGEGTCLRLIGARPRDIETLEIGEGINTFSVDIGPSDWVRTWLRLCGTPDSCDMCYKCFGAWIRVTGRENREGPSFFYPAFGLDAPTRFEVTSLEVVNGPAIPPFPAWRPPSELDRNSQYTLVSFNVGQGMASLVYNDRQGFLLDAGAGTPIKRPGYPTLTTNDLAHLCKGKALKLILSHGDSDHWRLLAWDDVLRDAIDEIIVPSGMRSIAFFDKRVKHKTRQLSGDERVDLGGACELCLHRSRPLHLTSNNDGLVSIFRKEGEQALVPGDYVYREMTRDGNPAIGRLPGESTKAVVVPHHGDEASANDVPPAAPGAIAFFSAGDHAGYQHPKAVAVQKHLAAHYTLHGKTSASPPPVAITVVPLL